MIVTVVLDFDDEDIKEANRGRVDFEDVAQSIRARMEEVFLGTGHDGSVVVETQPTVLDVFQTSLPL